MLISTKGRYALRVVLDLAQHAGDGYVSLKSVAERQDVSVKYLESIVALLQKGGVLTSQRGTQGGYRLACPASELSVYEIVRLTEGSLPSPAWRILTPPSAASAVAPASALPSPSGRGLNAASWSTSPA